MNNKTKLILFFFTVLALLLFADFIFGLAPKAKKIKWGVNFSQKQTELLGLDWQRVYSALLDDLKIRYFKIATYWDLLEKREGLYDFRDLNWQIDQAGARGAEIILVVGMKTPRWPECHMPGWAGNLSKDEQQEKILKLIEKIVLNYGERVSIVAWQVENEPFFQFGECPWQDKNFLQKEISLIKSLDNKKRPIIISASGEWSFWTKEAKIGDRVGISIYKIAWFPQYKSYIRYYFPPTFYWLKAQIIEKFLGKKVIVVELQAEPWGQSLLSSSPPEEQRKTMNSEQFKKNIDFARKTGFDEFYLWGAEWMYWLKEKQNQPEIWEEAKKLF